MNYYYSEQIARELNATRQPFHAGCTITNIRRGVGARAKNVYATLRGPDGEVLIVATLDYINAEIVKAGTAVEGRP